MKYLQYRNDFLSGDISIDKIDMSNQIKSSSLIRESVSENDIRWGDSLIGRLINSVLRKAKLYTKGTQIPKLVSEFKNELDSLLKELLFKDEKEQIDTVTVRLLLTEVYNVVISGIPIEEKVSQLIGDKPDYNQLIQKTIDSIQSIDDKSLQNKSVLVDKLKKFKDALIAMHITPSDEDVDNSHDMLYNNTIKLLKSVVELNNLIINKKVQIDNIDNTTKPDISIKKDSEQENKEVSQPVEAESHKESIMGFWNFLNKVNEELKDVKNIGDRSLKDEKNNLTRNLSDPKKNKDFINNRLKEINDEMSRRKGMSPKSSNNDTKGIENSNKPMVTKQSSEKSPARIAWNKVLIAFKKSEISKYIGTIKELENADKKEVIKFGKQIVINSTTVGKPISYDELIKEDITINSPTKSISLLARVILAFNDDLLNSMGPASQCIKSFIESYNDMTKNSNQSKVNEELNTSDDKIKDAWYKEFKNGEEKEWKVKDEVINDLKTKSEKSEGEKVNVDPRSEDPEWKGFIEDHIIKIVNIFGKAYDKYAVDEISSGRLDARISHKTFSEYTYIGKSGSRPKWEKEANPGYGPWASKFAFNQWQDGITHILEDGKYRKVLANINFESRSEKETGTKQKTPGSGKTLFRFISDMISYGEDHDFRSKRHRLLTNYFNADISNNDESGYGGETKSKEDKGDPSQLKWSEDNLLTRGKGPKDWKEKEKGAFKKFIRINYKNEKQNTEEIIGYITEVIEENGNNLVIKFHKGGGGGVKKESLISSYMKNLKGKSVAKKTLPKDLTNGESPIFVGVINNPIISNNGELTFKYIKIDDISGLDNMGVNDISTLKMTKINKVDYLKYIVENNDGSQSQVLLNFNKDYLDGGVIKKRPKNDKSYGDIKETLKKAINEGKFNV